MAASTLTIIYTLCLLIPTSISWPNHDISTLKLLQVVHRHGDRAVTKVYRNDPYTKNLTQYWSEGLGQLSPEGRYHMYRMGQYVRHNYHKYLGGEYNPREVYARSSAKTRCLESAASLLAGAYPPNNTDRQWANGSAAALVGQYWQPIPVETYLPMDEDRVLRTEAYCPTVDNAMDAIESSGRVQQALAPERTFLAQLSKVFGQSIRTTLEAKNVYDHLVTEYDRGYKWSDQGVWSREYERQVLAKLQPLTRLLWVTEWDSSVVERLRAGPLLAQLVGNMNLAVNVNSTANSLRPKLYLYSTHDSTLAVLMHALGVFNNEIVPLSATLFVELHQGQSGQHFVRLYFYNDSRVEAPEPYELRIPDCGGVNGCPYAMFIEAANDMIPTDWEGECGLTTDANDQDFFHAMRL